GDVADRDAELSAVGEMLADHLAAVPDHDDDVADPELVAQQLDVALDEGDAVDLEHRLRHPLRVRVRPNSPSCGGDQANEFCRHPRAGPRPIGPAPITTPSAPRPPAGGGGPEMRA